jgi:hypothetical protein
VGRLAHPAMVDGRSRRKAQTNRPHRRDRTEGKTGGERTWLTVQYRFSTDCCVLCV